jgi:hypothetical protein
MAAFSICDAPLMFFFAVFLLLSVAASTTKLTIQYLQKPFSNVNLTIPASNKGIISGYANREEVAAD